MERCDWSVSLGGAGSPDHQLTIQGYRAGRAFGIGDAFEEQFGRCGADIGGGLGDQGDGRIDQERPGSFVEPNQTDIPRDGEPQLADGQQRTGGEQAVAGKDRLGRLV